MPGYSNLQDLLASITETILSGDSDIDRVLKRHQVDSPDTRELVELIDTLYHSLNPVAPSPQFVRRLRNDLVGTDSSNVLVKVRRLPPRVQIAAGLALMAGVFLLSRRRGLGERDSKPQETLVAQ
jgi:hypothetical protein